VTLTAVAAAQGADTSTFDGWGGACAQAGAAATCTLTVDSPKTVSATFTRRTVGVTVERKLPPDPDPLKRRLVATITARSGCGPIQSVQFGKDGQSLDSASNTIVDVMPGGPTRRAAGFAHTPAPGSTQVRFEVYRVQLGSATVPLSIVDGCGRWDTFVGGGPDAF
jgi:hypothetical protein